MNLIGGETNLHFQESFELFCKYQKVVHKDPVEKLNAKRVSKYDL